MELGGSDSLAEWSKAPRSGRGLSGAGMKEQAYFLRSCSVLVLRTEKFFRSRSVLVLDREKKFCSCSVLVL